jgi:hypothetical protein
MVDAAYAALVLLALLPAMLLRYPQSADYLNHLVRLHVLASQADDPVRALYRPEWHLMPNLGFDLVGLAFAQILPIGAAAKAVWFLSVVGLAVAVWFVARVLHGRTQITLLLAVPCLLCLPVTAGFVGFTLGLAAALAAIGLWFRMGAKVTPTTLVVMNLVGAAILILHQAAFDALAVTIVALHSLQKPWRPVAIIRRAATVALGFALPAVLLQFMEKPALTVGGPVFTIVGKIGLLPELAFTANTIADTVGTLAIVLGLYLVLRPGGGRCDGRLAPVLLFWLGLLMIMPREVGRATAIDMRLVVFPGLLLIAGLSAGTMSQARSNALVVLAMVAVILRTILLLPDWAGYNHAVEGFRVIEGTVRSGARVIVAETDGGGCGPLAPWRPFYEHIPVLLVTDRAAFVPTVFSARGMQPIRAAEAFREIMDPDAPVLPFWALLKSDTAEGIDELMKAVSTSAWRPYFLNWRRDYDYLALLDLACGPKAPVGQGLELVGVSPAYRIFRIVHPAG